MHCPKFYISAEITGTITDSSNWEPVGCEVFAVINIESIIIHITTITITISQSSDLVQLRESSKGGETGWWKLPSSSFPASPPIIPQVHFTHHYKRTEHHISSSLKTNFKNSLSISALIPPPVSSWLLIWASKDSTGGGGPPITQLATSSFFLESSFWACDNGGSAGSVLICCCNRWSCCCCISDGGGGSAGFDGATVIGSIATLMFFSLVFPT